MKRPSGSVLHHGLMWLTCGGLCLLLLLPTAQDQLQTAAVVVLSCLAILVGVLIMLRIRWSPELMAGVLLLVVLGGVASCLLLGYNLRRLGTVVVAGAGLWLGYPDLRRAIRG